MSDEPANLGFEDATCWSAKRPRGSAAGPRSTLGDLQRTTPWVWLRFERCRYHAPPACAVAVMR
jgi:hypothetical protein